MPRYKQPYSLFKRGKYWYYQTYDIDGKRTVAKTTGKTSKTEARNYCESLYLEGNLSYSRHIFKAYFRNFFDDNSPFVKDRPKPLSKNTLHNYRSKYKNSLLPYFGEYELQDITYNVLKEYRIGLLEKYAPNSVVVDMNVLKLLLTSAYRNRAIKTNPFDFLEKYAIIENQNKDAFVLEEIKQIYNRLDDLDFKKLFLLMALSGLRISEAVGARSCDVVKTEEVTYIDLKQQYLHGEYQICKHNSGRQVPISPTLELCLNFPVKRLSTFYSVFTPIKNEYENENRKLSFHSLRHFFATNSKSLGVPDIKVEYILGHRQRGTKAVYTNFRAVDVKDIVNWQEETIKKIGVRSEDLTPKE